MANTTTTPLMGLTLPVPGTRPGPLYATDLVTALDGVDAHTHQPGSGARITTAALDIDADLTIGSHNLESIRSLRLDNQVASLALAADIRSLYSVAGDLYYNNSSGNAIQITSGSGINAASIGGIGGDYGTSTASVTYSNTLKNFLFTQSSGVTAKMSVGDLSIYENVASANPITISSPTSLVSAYTLTLPTALPNSGSKILMVSSAGAMSATLGVDNSSVEISSNNIQIKASGVNTTQIADQAVTQAKLAPRPTGTSVSAGGVAISGGTGVVSYTASASWQDVTALNVTITTTGRPVMAMLMPAGNTGTYSRCSVETSSGGAFQLRLLRDGSEVSFIRTEILTGTFFIQTPSAYQFVDTPAAGTYNYKIQVNTLGSYQTNFYYVKLMVYEM